MKTSVSILLIAAFAVHTCVSGQEAPAEATTVFDGDEVSSAEQLAATGGDVTFITEGEREDTRTKRKLPADSNAIPLDFLEQMDNVTDIGDFINKFVAPDSIDPQYGIQYKYGEGKGKVERAAGNVAKPAGCIPDNTVVPLLPLNPSKDPSITYHPRCTRIKRCNGCCSSPLLSCQPVVVEPMDFTILKLQYNGKRQLALREQEHVVVEQHIKCKCDCRIKKNDCNSNQIYDASQCKCHCTNNDERDKCIAQEEKIWDYETCKCKCRESHQCTTGLYFDDHQCKCTEIVIPGGVRTANRATSPAILDRRRFIVKAIPVDESNSTVYSTEG